jgi:hypothetical protein
MSFRLPKTLAYTALHCAIASTLACSGGGNSDNHVDPPPVGDGSTSDVATNDGPSTPDGPVDASGNDGARDASSDIVVYDALPDCDGGEPNFCGPATPDAGGCDVYVCGFDCPPGCEPYV